MRPPSSRQLTLGVTLDDNATFANFLVAEPNKQAVACLSDSTAPEQFIALWGSHACGLTHLLQAACHQRAVEQRNSLYIALDDPAGLQPEILEGAHNLALVCIDRLELLAGDPAWEAALFTAFNAIKDSHTQLIVAADRAPAVLPIQLPDLLSRLQSALVLQITELDDNQKRQALQLRASNRGMELSDAVADYILLRSDRSLRELMRVLDQLDASSLTQQRKLTIPLVKSTMGW